MVQGSPVDATPFVRLETFDIVGSARDRRSQYRPIVLTKLALFALALAWASRIKWSIDRPFRIFYRLAIGALLFVFGRVHASVLILLLRRFIPDASMMALASWWWPALLGPLLILGGGLVAWIGQARLTDIVPGRRGATAVGSIFALVALGACSHFVTALVIFDQPEGWGNFVALLLSATCLAMLFAFAARTGPPVPHYFMLGPILASVFVGLSLMKAAPRQLWLMAGVSALLCVAAWLRHRIAVARGTEEPEPTPEEAAESDTEKMIKIEKKLSDKL